MADDGKPAPLSVALDQLRLSRWPTPARITVSLFVAMLGFGYLGALGNLYHRHELADGQPGLTDNDLKAHFHGITVDVEDDASDVVAMSRMLEKVVPGASMRKHLTAGDEADVRTLIAWLEQGAQASTFQTESLVQEGDPSAEDVIAGRCLRCHNADDGEKADTPYGPDIFTVEQDMVYRYAKPGTAVDTIADADAMPGRKKIGPQTLAQLFLVTHIHMLSIPVFTLILAGLFALTGWSTRWKTIIGPLPMIAIAVDFAGWWLARSSEMFLPLLLIAGPVFGLSLAMQIFAVLGSLWFGSKDANRD